MFFRKIQGPLRIDSPDETVVEYPLSPSRGGSSTKVVQYMVKVIATNAPGDTKVGIKLHHGPDGSVSVLHSTPISPTAPATIPGVVAGDADSSTIIGEYLFPILTIQGPTGGPPVFAIVEVYEMRKPF